MIVLEVKFVSNENDFVSMSADVLGKTRDMQALAEEKEFEDTIIPVAMNQINSFYYIHTDTKEKNQITNNCIKQSTQKQQENVVLYYVTTSVLCTDLIKNFTTVITILFKMTF